MPVEVKIDRVSEITRTVKQLLKAEVLVGIPDTAGAHPGTNIDNAAIGYLNEFGSPAQNIPPRPFLVPGVDRVKAQFIEPLRAAALAAVKGDGARVDVALNTVGLIASSSVKNEMTDGFFEPLKPSTLAARRSRGRSGDKPLIDTGALRNSVTYVIRK